MIFSGDFVHPYTYSADRFKKLDAEFLGEKKMLNFESTLEHLNGKRLTKGIALSSNKDALKSLKDLNVEAVSLSNNHIFDFDYKIESFKDYFNLGAIGTFGIGDNLKEACQPYIDHEEKLLVLTFGWDVISCIYASADKKGVNPYKYRWVENQLKEYRSAFADFRIVLFMHWNYELEIYPQPADRQFSFRLIDLGADAIIGHHNHMVSGFEFYKNKPILYSLGNFYMPQIEYNGFKLNFPESSLIGVSVSLQKNNPVRYFLHEQSRDGHEIKILEKGKIEDSEYLKKLSGFQGLTHTEYSKFYEKHKYHKNKLLPTFKTYTSIWNGAKRKFVKLRQIPINFYSRKIKK